MHVLYEDKLWASAFNLTIGIQSLYEFMLNWFAETSSDTNFLKISHSSTKSDHYHEEIEMISVSMVLKKVLDKIFTWQHVSSYYYNYDYLLYETSLSSLLYHECFLLISSNLIKSFHFPLHHFLAYVVLECSKYPHLTSALSTLQSYLSSDLSSTLTLMKVACNSLTLAKEIEIGLWRKNGIVMEHQHLNYCQPPFCRINYDLDLTILQLCLMILPSSLFLAMFLSSFGIGTYLFPLNPSSSSSTASSAILLNDMTRDENNTVNIDVSHLLSSFLSSSGNLPTNLSALASSLSAFTSTGNSSSSSSSDKEYLPALVAESLSLLINILNELPSIPSYSNEERLSYKVRREWINRLAGGIATYSQLQECLTSYPDTTKLNSDILDFILSEISIKQILNPLSPPKYSLKRELWFEYDPCFPHITKAMHEIALDRKPKPIRDEPIVGRQPTVTTASTATAAGGADADAAGGGNSTISSSHPLFHNIRYTLLFSNDFFSFLRQIFFSIIKKKFPTNQKNSQEMKEKMKPNDYQTGYFTSLPLLNDTCYAYAIQLITMMIHLIKQEEENQEEEAQGPMKSENIATEGRNNSGSMLCLSLKSKFFQFVLLEKSDSHSSTSSSSSSSSASYDSPIASSISFPSLLKVWFDLHKLFKISFDTRSDQYYLEWILKYCRDNSIDCQYQLQSYENTTSSLDHENNEKQVRMKATLEKSMGDMATKAQKFLEMFGDISDSDEEENEEQQQEEDERGATATENDDDEEVTRSEGNREGGGYNTTLMTETVEEEEEDLDAHHYRSQRRRKGTEEKVLPKEGKEGENDEMETELKEEIFAENSCIICKIDHSSSSSSSSSMDQSIEHRLGFLILLQPSTVLWKKENINFVSIDLIEPSPNPLIFSKIPYHTCNPRIGLCGHVMHFSCYLHYIHSVKAKSTQQNDMILDSEKGYFPCPLCKRLCNGFFPHHPFTSISNEKGDKLSSSSSSSRIGDIVEELNEEKKFISGLEWIQSIYQFWKNEDSSMFSSSTSAKFYSCDKEATSIYFPKFINDLQGNIISHRLVNGLFFLFSVFLLNIVLLFIS
jgi:hypothetical protein